MKTVASSVITPPSVPPSLALAGPLASIWPYLESVEAALIAQSESVDPAVAGIVNHSCAQGGKRLRPALVLLCANALGNIRPPQLDLAVSLELIHAASLVHDDIMDAATERRGLPTASSLWGNKVAVKLGDLLMTRALSIVAGLGSRPASDLVVDSAARLCQGEILQSRNVHNPFMTREQYYEIASLKTGSLFSAAAGGAALLSASAQSAVASLREFGRLLGVSYQVYDDCADLMGSSGSTGKTVGTDLESGTMTLPIIMFMEKHPNSARPRVLSALRALARESLGNKRRALVQSGVISSSVRAGLDLLDEAETHLSRLPAPPAASEPLRQVIDHIRHLFLGVALIS